MNKALFAVVIVFLAMALIDMSEGRGKHHHHHRKCSNATSSRGKTLANLGCALGCSRESKSTLWGSCINAKCVCYDPSTCTPSGPSNSTTTTTTLPSVVTTPGDVTTDAPVSELTPTPAIPVDEEKRSADGHKEHNILFGRSADGHKEHNILFGRSADGHKEHNILFGRSADGHKQHNILFG